MGLVAELKRRNVFRMAVLYAVSAWLIMQVAEVVVSLGNLPGWIGPATLTVLAIGFPIALAFSWFYEFTPEGLSLERGVSPGEPITHAAGRRMDFIVIALLSAALLLLAYDKWALPEADEQSIAVLPFSNSVSDDEAVGFLSTGIQVGLLNRLSQIGTLKVISRQSADRYRDSTKSFGEIGAELGVRNILVGSIRRSGDDIRVEVQLTDVLQDEQVWAQTFDRRLTASNIFAIQSEIVGKTLGQLNARLTPEQTQHLAALPTTNLEAYTEYLRGMRNSDTESVESMHAAVENFKRATEIDPAFALAYVGLADAYLTLGANFYGGLPVDESTALAQPPIMKALELDPLLGEAHASLAFLRQLQGDISAAEQSYERAITLRPNYPRVFRRLGRLRWRQERRDEAMDFMVKALRLDPNSATVNYDIGRLYDESGQFDQALEQYLRVIDIEPDHAFAYVYVAALHYLVYGQVDESLIWYHKAAKNDALSPSLQTGQAVAYLELGDPESARHWVRRGLELGPSTFWAVWNSALLNLYEDNTDAAISDARKLLESYPANWGALKILRNMDIVAGRYEVARARYARVFRELTEPEIPLVTAENYVVAIDLALVLMRLEETDRANDLLSGSLAVIEELPRLGTAGYWISDVQIYAILNQKDRALAALKEAVNDGWRLFTWWLLVDDPNLDSIRDTGEFRALKAQVQADLSRQADRVRELKASGELARSVSYRQFLSCQDLKIVRWPPVSPAHSDRACEDPDRAITRMMTGVANVVTSAMMTIAE